MPRVQQIITGHEPSSLHTRRLKSQHHQNSSSTSTTPALSVSCIPPLSSYFPHHVLGPGVLVSRGPLALSPSLSARALLSRLASARSAKPSRPCYRRLGPQFAVGENFSTGYGRFLHSLHLCYRLPSQTRTRLPIVSTVIGSTPPLPLQVSSGCSVTATIHSLGWHPTAPSPHPVPSPRSRPSVTLSCHIALPRWRMSTPWVLK